MSYELTQEQRLGMQATLNVTYVTSPKRRKHSQQGVSVNVQPWRWTMETALYHVSTLCSDLQDLYPEKEEKR